MKSMLEHLDKRCSTWQDANFSISDIALMERGSIKPVVAAGAMASLQLVVLSNSIMGAPRVCSE